MQLFAGPHVPNADVRTAGGNEPLAVRHEPNLPEFAAALDIGRVGRPDGLAGAEVIHADALARRRLVVPGLTDNGEELPVWRLLDGPVCQVRVSNLADSFAGLGLD